jgi:hypothetical protein
MAVDIIHIGVITINNKDRVEMATSDSKTVKPSYSE